MRHRDPSLHSALDSFVPAAGENMSQSIVVECPVVFASHTSDLNAIVEDLAKIVYIAPYFQATPSGNRVAREIVGKLDECDLFYFVWGNRPGSSTSTLVPYVPVIHWEYSTYDHLLDRNQPHGCYLSFWGKKHSGAASSSSPADVLRMVHGEFIDRTFRAGVTSQWIKILDEDDVLVHALPEEREALAAALQRLASSDEPGYTLVHEPLAVQVALRAIIVRLVGSNLSAIAERNYRQPLRETVGALLFDRVDGAIQQNWLYVIGALSSLLALASCAFAYLGTSFRASFYGTPIVVTGLVAMTSALALLTLTALQGALAKAPHQLRLRGEDRS